MWLPIIYLNANSYTPVIKEHFTETVRATPPILLKEQVASAVRSCCEEQREGQRSFPKGEEEIIPNLPPKEKNNYLSTLIFLVNKVNVN